MKGRSNNAPRGGGKVDHSVESGKGVAPCSTPARKVSIKGNPNVFAEAKAQGGAARIDGKKAAMRLDRPGRKRGGRCGADTSPLSNAGRSSD